MILIASTNIAILIFVSTEFYSGHEKYKHRCGEVCPTWLRVTL
ncbi:hypothetical protein PI124_g17460 [Phytophthora idaei]|nr:hypothetical protein PI125_g19034 [Phytophthora idaei]KAG3237555.1 hypothetical protein PI124_g17460 [Phytophthora idaei]